MKKVDINFYSYKPRLRVGLSWTTDFIPRVGDMIKIPNEFISEWSKSFFSEFDRTYGRTFNVKSVKLLLNNKEHYNRADIVIKLDWTDRDKARISKWLKEKK